MTGQSRAASQVPYKKGKLKRRKKTKKNSGNVLTGLPLYLETWKNLKFDSLGKKKRGVHI